MNVAAPLSMHWLPSMTGKVHTVRIGLRVVSVEFIWERLNVIPAREHGRKLLHQEYTKDIKAVEM